MKEEELNCVSMCGDNRAGGPHMGDPPGMTWCPQAQGGSYLAGLWEIMGTEHPEALK